MADVYSVYGISFIAEGGGSPRLGDIRLWFDLSPYDRVLINAPISGTSANRSLILQFRLPLRRLGLFLGGAPAGVPARVSAYGAKNQLLGTVEQDLGTAVRGTFVGIETTAADGIFSAVVDYGAESAPELIHRLLADFVSSPRARQLHESAAHLPRLIFQCLHEKKGQSHPSFRLPLAFFVSE